MRYKYELTITLPFVTMHKTYKELKTAMKIKDAATSGGHKATVTVIDGYKFTPLKSSNKK